MPRPCVWFLRACLLLTFAHAQLPSMAVWQYGNRPFNVSVRWEYCLKSHVDIRVDDTVIDYGVLLSQELAKLSDSGGGSIRLLDGTYIVKSAIVFRNNTCLLGQSLNGVTIKVADDAPAFEYVRGVLHGINVENITVREITLDANKKGQDDEKCENELTKYGTYFEASSYLWFTDTRVMNACAYGYDLPGNNVTFSTNVVIEKSYADSSGKDGIKIFRMLQVSLLGTLTLNNGRHGVHIAHSENVLLEGNTFAADGAKESYKGCGVLITDRYGMWSNGIIARYNRIHNFYRAGFCLGKARWVALLDSTITNNRHEKATCYDIDGAEDVTIVRGTCSTLNHEENKIWEGKYGTTRIMDASAAAEGSPEPTGCLMTEIEADGVCCPGICGKCGGDGCSERAPFQACCVDEIRKPSDTNVAAPTEKVPVAPSLESKMTAPGGDSNKPEPAKNAKDCCGRCDANKN